MKHRVTLETAIILAKYGIGPICGSPPPVGSTSWVILQHNLFVYITMIHLILNISVFLHNVYKNGHGAIEIIKRVSEIGALLSVLMKMIICKIEAPRIQVLMDNMETFLKQATHNEKEIIQNHVDKCLMTNAIALVSAILGPLAFIAGPLLTSQLFPGDIAYPFSTESNWVWATLYISQSICVLQVGSMVVVDMFFGILLWYAGARLQMLCLELRRATNADELSRCIEKHQELIRYVDQLRITTRIIAVPVTAVAIYSVTFGGFILVADPSLYEMIKYVFYELGSALELFLFTWPADNLIDVSEKVGDAAYNCDWIGKPPEMLKNVMIVIQRCKDPMIISVNGLLPVLSLEFYGSTMAASFSYLTTLRAITLD